MNIQQYCTQLYLLGFQISLDYQYLKVKKQFTFYRVCTTFSAEKKRQTTLLCLSIQCNYQIRIMQLIRVNASKYEYCDDNDNRETMWHYPGTVCSLPHTFRRGACGEGDPNRPPGHHLALTPHLAQVPRMSGTNPPHPAG